MKVRVKTPQGGYVFKNSMGLEIIEICFIYQTNDIIFKDARTLTSLKARTNLCTRAVKSAPLFIRVDSSVYDKSQEYRPILINHFVGPNLGPNFLLMLSTDNKKSRIAMFNTKEAAMGSVARCGGIDQRLSCCKQADVAHLT